MLRWDLPLSQIHSTPTAMQLRMFGNVTVFLLMAYNFLITFGYSQDVQTFELFTSEVHPLFAKIGNACLIQLPFEPIATNVGDPMMWMVEKIERTVSVKPISEGARDTNLAIVTRGGTLNFSIRLVPDTEPYTQMIRITKVIDDSSVLPKEEQRSSETLADIIIQEIRIAQNYYALKTVNSPDLKNVEQFIQMHDSGNKNHHCVLLQSFRFRDTRHILLHFITENNGEKPLTFDQRRTTVSIGDTLFAPIAVSLGKTTLEPHGHGSSAENFLVLDGGSGLSPHQKFNILLPEILESN